MQRGRFVFIEAPGLTLTAPRAIAAPRVTALVSASVPLGAVVTRRQRRRLATAARQDMWRRLRNQRGLGPVVAVTGPDDDPTITLAACYLNGALAPASTAAELAEMLRPSHLSRWLRQSDGLRATAAPHSAVSAP